jgi:hypothetical protein
VMAFCGTAGCFHAKEAVVPCSLKLSLEAGHSAGKRAKEAK